MQRGIVTKTEVKQILFTTKKIAFTLFFGFSAAYSDGKIVREKMSATIGHYFWYNEFLYCSQFIYGALSARIIYMILLKHSSNKPGSERD